MKTRYTKTLCVVALLGTATVVSAQTENTEKEKNLNREMTLEREYDPTVQDANKVNTLPVVKEPTVKKAAIDYASFTIPAEPDKEIGLLPSGNIMTEMQYNKRRGYFNFGAGTYLNLNGDLGYHILSTEKDKLNIFYSHRSTNGKVKYIDSDEKIKAKLNDNLGGINFKHEFEKMALSLGAKYGYTGFNYYGLPIIHPVLSSRPEADRETNQVNQSIRVNAGVESKEGAPFGYLLDIDYTNFSHKYGLRKEADGITEHTIGAKFDLNAAFGGNQKIGLGGKIDVFNYAYPELLLIPVALGSSSYREYKAEFANHAEATLSPYYTITGDSWNVKLGVNAMFITGDNSKIFASPNVSADVEVADKTVLYGIATGSMNSNSAFELSQENRYINPSVEALPTRTWLDATIGIKSAVLPGFWFDIFGGYKVMNDAAFFVPFNGYNENGDFGNVSSAFQMDANLFRGGVSLKYAYQQLFDISLKAVYNAWGGDITKSYSTGGNTFKYAPYGKPEMEINAGIEIKPVNRLSMLFDYYLATGRKTLLFDGPHTMKNINELNLTSSYAFNDTFGVYIKLNNLLFQKYEVLYGYPLQSFSAMVGVNINF